MKRFYKYFVAVALALMLAIPTVGFADKAVTSIRDLSSRGLFGFQLRFMGRTWIAYVTNGTNSTNGDFVRFTYNGTTDDTSYAAEYFVRTTNTWTACDPTAVNATRPNGESWRIWVN